MRSRDPEHIPLGVQSVVRAIVLLSIHQHTKLEMPSFTRSKDIIWATNF